MELRACARRYYRAAFQPFSIGFALLCSLSSVSLSTLAQSAPGRLPGHVPPIVARAEAIGRTSAREMVPLALVLPLRNQAQLDDLLIRLYDPDDPAYGQYLTSQQFNSRFAPTQADYDALIDFARQNGLTVTATHANRLVLDVAGPARNIETAFGVKLQQYVLADGTTFRAPDRDPVVPPALAGRLQAVVGLDTASVWRPHCIQRPVNGFDVIEGWFHPNTTGSGPNGGLAPSDIKKAYSLNTLTLNGSGQTLALFELDGYTPSDITSYENYFGLTHVPLQNVLVDTATGSAGSGADEVTLDIELQAALAPGITKIIVYEGPNSSTGVIDTYNRIATDNLAKSISTSWGEYEAGSGTSTLNSENTIFQQMAAQGQSIFAAAGDSGAYDNGRTLSVDDPASQPYVTGCGGTSLTTAGAGGVWSTETTWNGGSVNAGAGGGGISSVWSIPSYQPASLITSANKGSTSKRNVPDVSLNADPNNGYAIYYGGGWTVFGGTSCAAPLWSAFTALVNQQRAANSKSVLGFANPSLYSIGLGTDYTSDFHDIADGSTNLYYPAVTGYDLATGWGSFKGASLLADLSGVSIAFALSSVSVAPASVAGGTGATGTVTMTTAATANTAVALSSNNAAATVPASVTVLTGQNTATFPITTSAVTATTTATITATLGTTSTTAQLTVTNPNLQQLLGNPGFETGTAAPWVASAGVIDGSGQEPPHSGSWVAWLDGYGRTHTDTLYQQVTIPSTITTATLTFYLHIDTAETTKTAAHDTLKVEVRNSSGAVLTTLATYSNLNAAAGYSLQTFNLSAYKGQTIQVYLIGTENNSLQTSFVVDDFALNVQ